ncbi:DUF2238 domain-containing protein [Rubritalea spongiae]|uniref:DUF2238 domain-containing protein n=1 Tax=Rubritalea spongiae TaxID=430797 RepID=A0ABW5E2A7_9BACT
MIVQPKRQRIAGVVAFTLLYQCGLAILAVIQHNYEFLYYSAIQLFFVALLCIAHKRIHYSISLLWLLSLWGLLHLASGIFFVPESWGETGEPKALQNFRIISQLRYQHLEHFCGFFLVTWVSWQTLCSIIHTRYQRRLMPTFGLLLLCATSSMGYGAFNELAEFLATKIMEDTLKTGYQDTSWDMVANTAGVFFASITIKLRNL